MLMILLSGAAVFFLMPRMSAGYMGAYSFGTDISSGFSDHVQLGQIGQIQQSNALVMHIQIDGDRVGRSDLHWRGVALARFRRTHLVESPRAVHVAAATGQQLSRPTRQCGTALFRDSLRNPAIWRAEHMIHYRVLMEPIGTNVFFLAPWARNVSGNYRMLAADSSGAVYNFDTSRAISRYEADSDIATAAPAELRAAGQNYPAQVTATYLRLAGARSASSAPGGANHKLRQQRFRPSRRPRELSQDALRLHPGIAADRGERSHRQFPV